MATISTSTSIRTLADAHRQVRSPLDRLRGHIRTYVGLEGALVLGLYVAPWFWIGLALDYGFFKLFGIDWVQQLPWIFRAALLGLLSAGLLAAVSLKVLTRLFREFRDPALALVLERRFPDILGDRLITAVELSDPDKAAEYGYSPAMVRETIHEAARRVANLPIKEVFDWKRLKRRGILVGVLTLGVYLLVGAGFTTFASVQQGGFTLAGFSDLHEVSGIWFERNILLQDTIWPRRAHLELIDFPAGGEVRMGRGGNPPTIRARALKYVIAGAPSRKAQDDFRAALAARGESPRRVEELAQAFRKKPPEGWRGLAWVDLTPELLGGPVPQIELPKEWVPRNPAAGLTLDEIELKLDKEETHKDLDPDVKNALRRVLEQVEQRAQDPSLSRKLRALKIPDEVALVYKGNTTSSRTTLQKVADNEYTGSFGELRETVTFTVQGEDYSTAPRRVVVVEPPVLETLTRAEERPAYIYYRPSLDGKPEDLRGKKQVFEEAGVSLQGGEVSRIDVPAGTNLTLTARASKELLFVGIKPRKEGIEIKATPPTMEDGQTFRTRLEDVRQEQAFAFEFTDTDGVVGRRQVLVVPAEDAAPKIRELAPDDIIRKTKDGFMVAVSARIPFKGKVSDDYGLSAVRYVYTIRRRESQSGSGVRPLFALLEAIQAFAPQGQGFLPGAVTVTLAARGGEKPQDPASGGRQPPVAPPARRQPLPRFEQTVRDRLDLKEFLPLPEILALLDRKQRLPYRALTSEFEVRADDWLRAEEDPLGCDFPLWKLALKETDPRKSQLSYVMELQLEAVDTDLDGPLVAGRPQPHAKLSDEKFTFLVVSENELLIEIAKEEEKLYGDLEAAVNKVLETEAKLGQVYLDLSSERLKAENLGPMSIRCEQVGEVLEKNQLAVRDVFTAYSKILRELKTNQVDARILDRVKTRIVEPLGAVDADFEKTCDAVLAFRKALDNNELALDLRIGAARVGGMVAKEQMRDLIGKLNAILGAMEGMTDINKVIKMLEEIRKREEEQSETVKRLKDDLERIILQGVLEKKPGEK
jgi:hypothetical protein